jgi:hypothetical protein
VRHVVIIYNFKQFTSREKADNFWEQKGYEKVENEFAE